MVFRLQFSVHDKPQTLQHFRTNVKAVTCWFFYNCDMFTLWQMQNQMWFFVSGLNIEDNSQTTVLKVYAESTWTWKTWFSYFASGRKTVTWFLLKNVWICQPQWILFRSEHFKCLHLVVLKLWHQTYMYSFFSLIV